MKAYLGRARIEKYHKVLVGNVNGHVEYHALARLQAARCAGALGGCRLRCITRFYESLVAGIIVTAALCSCVCLVSVAQEVPAYRDAKFPVEELRGFHRVSLEASETKTVGFTLGPGELSYLNRERQRVVEAGAFDAMVGGNSVDLISTNRNVVYR